MIRKVLATAVLLGIVVLSFLSSISSQPSFNGNTPGCGVSGCHTLQDGILSVAVINNTQVQITLSGTTASVAGELVDSTGTVVAVNNSTGNNPFILDAPGEGRYRVNAGYKDPSRVWDSTVITIALTAVGDWNSGEPGSYALRQNYPNPFNPATTIEYSLAGPAHVTLKVYDLTGREVATLVDGFEEPGAKSVRFDAAGLATGTYLYRLRAGEYSETKHLVVMR